MIKYLYGALLVCLFFACAPSRFVEPIEKDKIAVGANFGGQLLDFGATIPVPLSAIYCGYGLDTNLTVFGSLHTTALYFSNFQIDFGATYGFYNSKSSYIPSLSASGNGNFIWDINDSKVRFWPQIDANAYWNYGKNHHYSYLGMSNWFELDPKRSYDRPSISPWVFNLQLGTVIKHKSWQFQAEYKWLAPGYSSKDAFVPYLGIGGQGATGIYLGVSKLF